MNRMFLKGQMNVGDLVNIRDPIDDTIKCAVLLSVPTKKPYVGYTTIVLLNGRTFEILWETLFELNKKVRDDT